jgi:hypothetical protein
MRSLVREFGACIRTDKSQSHDLNVETGLCDGCHFNTTKSVCNKVVIPLSVRAVKDLNRYSKAIAWLIGAEQVSVEIVKSLAPLVFWHRTRFAGDEVERSPYFGDRFAYAEHLVGLAATRFAQREGAMKLMDDLRQGAADATALDQLKEMAKSDLLVNVDYVSFAKDLKRAPYVRMVKNIDKAVKGKDVSSLSEIHDELMRNTDFPNRSMLLGKVAEALHKLTLSQFTLTFEQWQELWSVIALRFPRMTSILKETLAPPKRKVVRTGGLTLVVYVTGDSADSSVFLEISGDAQAVEIKKEIEEHINA